MDKIRGSIIDNSLVGRDIDKYMLQNGHMPEYIVMSSGTVDAIKLRTGNAGRGLLEFHGVPIAVYDGLAFGDYDLV